ncbi:MAG: sigma-70 family RNA polymerase sigma factor, partial [Planctomycetaceae bacterium]|nr:sigma-70 family RNA polymerase sigma factor [Planctomycetaceae bacterium]
RLAEPLQADPAQPGSHDSSHVSDTRSTFILNAPSDDPRMTRTDPAPAPEERMSNHEEVLRLLNTLDLQAAQIVRMYHMEGKTYREISGLVGVPENSIGPTLSRARIKMRELGVNTPLNS